MDVYVNNGVYSSVLVRVAPLSKIAILKSRKRHIAI